MSEDNVALPEGFEVAMLQATLGPQVERSYGGVVVANFGVAGDDIERELPNLMASVEVAVHEKVAPANLVDSDGPMRLSELFGPDMPRVRTVPSPVAWVLHHNALATVRAKPERLERFVECLRRVNALGREQSMYFVESPGPAHLALAMMIADLDITLRSPDDTRGPPLIHIEVKRPDGEVVCVPAGWPFPIESAMPADAATIPLRAPRLRELVIALDEGGGDEAMTALVQEVMTRELPFLLVIHSDESLGMRIFGGMTGMPVFGDATTLEWMSKDIGIPSEAYSIVAITGAELFAMAAREKIGLAFATYRDRSSPLHATISADAVFELAQFVQ